MIFNLRQPLQRQLGLVLTVCSLSLAATLLLTGPVYAQVHNPQNDRYGLDTTANQATLDTRADRDLPTIIGQAVNYFFGALGVVFLTVILVGGYLWMTAGGNEEKVKQAKGFIINGVNGMIVIFLSYALVYLVITALRGAVTG
ncbi:MAG: hypothetical protein A2951_01255 [Candidatus Buchananbacteria bacterium RIFCSPLOWO2_01_FULL_56_15]|uniref:DUF4190 domain-containing protein n=1 Tax=Candidatus Buchananbacteria bacterium RIFCSPLOWO2_01_FULL_56_15 TaxID=1797547 RepID=A0A1G1YQK8_9BACT|nr:MAG: hypothetical protein A2951_01255 [Candidatus Buchananbacteria bacterium RIFCSPLOWO2_01_FULL_56_15]